jgi:hypothetical protein
MSLKLQFKHFRSSFGMVRGFCHLPVSMARLCEQQHNFDNVTLKRLLFTLASS